MGCHDDEIGADILRGFDDSVGGVAVGDVQGFVRHAAFGREPRRLGEDILNGLAHGFLIFGDRGRAGGRQRTGSPHIGDRDDGRLGAELLGEFEALIEPFGREFGTVCCNQDMLVHVRSLHIWTTTIAEASTLQLISIN